MIYLKDLLPENISVHSRDKKKEIFNYSSIIESAWKDLIHKAQEFQKIYFDLENDDTTGQKKTFYIEKNLRKDQPVKYEINAELCRAGGDWQYPVYYFRIELTSDYGLKSSDYDKAPKYIWDLKNDYSTLYKNYVIIPPSTTGNPLKIDGSKQFAYDNSEDAEPSIEGVDKKIWKWLEELIETAVNDRHKQLD